MYLVPWAGILNNLWGLGTEEEYGYRTGPPGYIGWPDGIHSLESIPGLHKRLKIRTLAYWTNMGGAHCTSFFLKVPSGQIGSALEWYNWIGLKKDINRTCFWFLILILNIWEEFKVLSRFLLVGITVCLESFFPIGCRTFICQKISRAAVFWVGLQIVGFLQIFYSQAEILRTIVDSPAFLEHGSAEKTVVCAHTTRDPNKEDD